MKVQKLVVHHSASKQSTTKKADIAKWHKERGFSQISYHKIIEGNGVIVNSRSENIQGAHAKGANQGSLGVCVVGNFEKEIPSQEQIYSLISVLTVWCEEHSLNSKDIYGHFNVPGGNTATSCPGKNLKSQLADIKQRVNQKFKVTTQTGEQG